MKFYRKTKAIGNVLLSLLGQSKNLRNKYPPVATADELIKKHYTFTSEKTRSLDLGCGSNPRKPFQANELFGIDIREDLEENINRQTYLQNVYLMTIICLISVPLMTL